MKKILLCLLFIMACDNPKPTPPRPTPVVKDTDYCEAAGKNLKNHGCITDDEHFTKKGKSFKLFCEETHNAGIYLNPICLSEIDPKTLLECQDMMDKCTYSK